MSKEKQLILRLETQIKIAKSKLKTLIDTPQHPESETLIREAHKDLRIAVEFLRIG